MPNYTPNLNLEKPLQTETYNIDVHNANSDKIDAASNEHRTAAVLDHPNGSVTEPKLAPEAVSTRALSKTGVAAGTYKSVTVDVKGRVTGGTNPTTLGGYGITDAYPKSTSDARYLPVRGKAVDAEKADGLTLVNLGYFKNKTIGELKSALKAWLQNTGENVASCRFNGNTGIDTLMNAWNTSDATVIQSGGIWTVTKISTFDNNSYGQFLFANYFSRRIYIANIENNVWGSMFSIPLNSDLITSVNGVSTIAGGAVNIPNATRSQSGVMSAADKTKLDGIEANANKYTLPPAGASVLGGIKVGANLGISNGVLSGTYATATTSAPGLLRRLSGNANDVMTGTGAWWNRAWKQAYSGTFTTVDGVICTLPANWVEVYVTASTFGYAALENSGVYSRFNQGRELEYGRGQCELQFKINSDNQVVLTSRGAGGDGVVRGVYYR